MDGILVINKPQNMTSFDVISVLRRKYGQKKFGHCGTLDPMASGVLVILAGKAAKALQFIEDTDKEYTAGLRLGVKTDTGDIWGKTLETKEPVLIDDFQSLLDALKGRQVQKIPAASAKKAGGKKLYEYLREGKEVPQLENEIEIYDLHALSPEDLPDAEPANRMDASDLRTVQDYYFHAACSSGTYIRALCEKIAERSNNLGSMSYLVRTKANGFDLSQAEDLNAPVHTVYPVSSILRYPKVQAEHPADIRNGKPASIKSSHDRVLLMDKDEVLAVYQRKSGDEFVCLRGLWS